MTELQFPSLPAGNLTWLGTFGSALIIIVIALCIATVFLGVRGNNNQVWGGRLLLAATGGICLALASLITLAVTSQFQFNYVRKHSALDHELQYRIASAWSGQEGSFLLWAVCSSLFVAWLYPKIGPYKRWYSVVAAAFLAALAGILTFESPFALTAAGADLSDGFGMPPSLMNYWVVIHPPTIFLGFGSLTALYAMSMAAMLHKNFQDWIPIIRPLAILAATILGLGLCMGGFWAYETLGWGGFWAWDPVENTSFVPWVCLAALIHGIYIQRANKGWQMANLLLAGLPFVLFGYGTFLTRSGFLGDTSVHSFAQMDSNALWILISLISLAIIAFFGIFIKTKIASKPEEETGSTKKLTWSRIPMFTAATWLLIFTGAIAGIGMSVPLIQSLLGQQPKVVEEHLYNTVCSFSYIPIVILMAITPFLTWNGITSAELAKKFINILAATIGTIGFLLLWLKYGGNELPLGPLAIGFTGQSADPRATVNILFDSVTVYRTPWVLFITGLTIFAAYANVVRTVQFGRKSKASIGGMLTHVGVLVTMAGLIFSRGLEQKVEATVHSSKTVSAFGYDLDLIGISETFTDRNNKVRIQMTKDGESIVATPGLYFVPGQDGMPQPFMWPFVKSHVLYDIYLVVGSFAIDEEGVDYGGSMPVLLASGEQAVFNDHVISYTGLTTQGTLGTAGATFIANTLVTLPDGSIQEAKPTLRIAGEGQLEHELAEIGQGLAIRLSKIDAKTKSAELEVLYTTPAYPIQVFYKPLTVLVWWGVGIMTIGGLIATFYRRQTRNSKNKLLATEPTDTTSENASE